MDPIYWGAAIASVRVSESTTPHSHDEDETFFIMSGNGRIDVDGENTPVAAGDVIFLPRGSTHTIANENAVEPLVFLTVFWASPEAKGALRRALQAEEAGELADA
ncbi:Cupin domain-containing protein [Puniceibacterium sediminis]|uniref:Cupin domain-containing protein n=2 Tax=Puniceibacterium sediminis TaxID=1608407 RepID=A0A238YVA6_9RHOB|nr:Cupin domain-containing protein [Puniceibacterium sediminis]